MNNSTPHKLIPRANMWVTLRAMREQALKGKKDLEIRRLVEKICEEVAEGDYAGELLAIYYWVKQNIRYMRDIDGVEFLKSPNQLIKTRSGDCDDIATLLAAMFMAAGNPVHFTIVAFNGGMPVFSHVYVEVVTPHGPVLFDPVANRVQHEMASNIKAKKTFPVSGGPGTHDAGIRGLGRYPSVSSSTGNTLYSVFDYRTGLFNYYEGGKALLPATGRVRAPVKVHKMGIVPESIAAKLPSGAIKVGEGKEAKGVIAARQGFAAFSLTPSVDPLSLALGVALGVAGYTLLKRM